MVKNLTDKIIRDARDRAEKFVKEAEEKLEKMLYDREKIISKEYAEKLAEAEKSADREAEKEISNFRLEKGKEILERKNRLIKEVMEKLEEKFNLYLKDNMEGIIAGLAKEINEEDYTVKVPETSGDISIKGVRVEKDGKLKNAFIFEGKSWSLLFNWERFSGAVSGYVREKAGRYLFEDNGNKK